MRRRRRKQKYVKSMGVVENVCKSVAKQWEVLHERTNKHKNQCHHTKSIKNSMKNISFKIEHAKSMRGFEKVIKLESKTDEFLTSLLTALQVDTRGHDLIVFYI